MNTRHSVIAALMTAAACAVLWIALHHLPSLAAQSELQFIRITGDSNFPRSVRVFVGAPESMNDDSVWILVASEPMMFGSSFKIDAGHGSVVLRLNDHTTGGTAQLYQIALPGVRSECIGNTNRLIALRNAVAVSDFVGLLK